MDSKLIMIDKLIKKCEQSSLVSFAYRDSAFSLQFNKRDNQDYPEIKHMNEENIEKECELSLSNMEISLDEFAVTGNKINGNEEIITIATSFVGTIELSKQIKNSDKNNYINQGDVICSIEAMKIYNDIKSPVSGKITEVLVSNGDLVEYEQPILKIKVDRYETKI